MFPNIVIISLSETAKKGNEALQLKMILRDLDSAYFAFRIAEINVIYLLISIMSVLAIAYEMVYLQPGVFAIMLLVLGFTMMQVIKAGVIL